MNKTLKKIIIVLVVVILIGVGASFFVKDDSAIQGSLQSITTGQTGSPLTQTATTNQAALNTEDVNREFVATLLNLQAINLDNKIFSEPAFTALVDNTVRLNQPGNEGRPNPFAPIGSDSVLYQAAANTAASAGSAIIEEPAQTEQTPAPEETSVSDEEILDDLLLGGS